VVLAITLLEIVLMCKDAQDAGEPDTISKLVQKLEDVVFVMDTIMMLEIVLIGRGSKGRVRPMHHQS